MLKRTLLFVSLVVLVARALPAESLARGSSNRFEPIDIFEIEWASDPQISPDGTKIVYVRNFMDIMKDRYRSNLWTINPDGTDHRPLTTGIANHTSPRWSPDGRRLLYTSSDSGSPQLHVRWIDSGQTAMLTRLARAPRLATWSRDGKQIAFVMSVDADTTSFATMPKAPEGAEWSKPPKVIESVQYRSDGSGYVEPVFSQIFVMSADGGTPRQVTRGAVHSGGRPEWSADGKSLLFSANRNEKWELDPRNSEIYEVTLAEGTIRALTSRAGPDQSPVLSPDSSKIAYLGSDERYLGYQVTRLYVMNRDGSESRLISSAVDRDVDAIQWAADGQSLYFQYDDHGNTKVARISLTGKVDSLAGDLGGTSLDRPYDGGSFSVAPSGTLVYTMSRPDYPADLAVVRRGQPARITRLNDDLFGHKKLGAVEEITYASSHDNRKIQGWIVKPPDFDPSKKYPLILEIHGGPFANYGDRFATDMQLYAAAGYVVLYTNPRGSTSYGEQFGNFIHHNYPGNDYDDLMSGVDAVIAKGYIDPANLFVTGGSGGGVLTSWIVGKTDRFRAAVVAKPVINWYSFVLTSDGPGFFYRYWFSALPWDDPDQYLRRSPISLVGNVKTPTMIVTGEADYRTPISESEQYYTALKIRGVPAALVRIPDSPHDFASRPSTMLSKFIHTLAWFERYRGK